MKKTAAILLVGLVAPLLAQAEEFEWTWEKDGDGKAPADSERMGKTTVSDDQKEMSAAYDRLLKDNLALRKKIISLGEGADAAKKENERLKKELQSTEKRVEQFAGLIKELENQRGATDVSQEKMTELQKQIDRAEREKSGLSKEIVVLKKKLASRGEDGAAPEPAAVVAPGSDLYAELQKENLALQARLSEVEAERQAARQAQMEVAALGTRAEQDATRLQSELVRAKTSEELHRKAIKKLLREMPATREELRALRAETAMQERRLKARDREVETLRAELRRREYRLEKTEKAALLLAKAREDMKRVNDREKRDMHFNMAVVYAKEGRFKDAEREYLHAVRMDPEDPDVHYNLGILYEESLKDPKRAAMHYRIYLRLNPDGAESAMVSNWLIQLAEPELTDPES